MSNIQFFAVFFLVALNSISAQTLIFLGDTQSPTIIDKNRFVYNNNDSARVEIYNTILGLGYSSW